MQKMKINTAGIISNLILEKIALTKLNTQKDITINNLQRELNYYKGGNNDDRGYETI